MYCNLDIIWKAFIDESNLQEVYGTKVEKVASDLKRSWKG